MSQRGRTPDKQIQKRTKKDSTGKRHRSKAKNNTTSIRNRTGKGGQRSIKKGEQTRTRKKQESNGQDGTSKDKNKNRKHAWTNEHKQRQKDRREHRWIDEKGQNEYPQYKTKEKHEHVRQMVKRRANRQTGKQSNT